MIKQLCFRIQDLGIELIFFTMLLLFTSSFLTAQEKGIYLENRSKNKTIFLPQNKKIKITTSEGKKLAGNYTIVDDKSILIKNQLISLSSVVAIKKYSTYSAITATAGIAVGSLFTVVGAAGIIAGGYGFIASPLAPIGLAMVLIPVLSNKHKREKWEYKIVN
ncbi:hypothetical protein SAMN05443667_10990 [Flavobacterium gillisiae]|uniref:Uncharacterized protein n=2 Tax=Flavobacterium gillisiae TaxID=150146 RepID=A0A1H4EAV4_9FLAO|nr:hypothetical protein SAMN05443667_10990 [Flavobacterium gillisiae]